MRRRGSERRIPRYMLLDSRLPLRHPGRRRAPICTSVRCEEPVCEGGSRVESCSGTGGTVCARWKWKRGRTGGCSTPTEWTLRGGPRKEGLRGGRGSVTGEFADFNLGKMQ